MGGDVTLERSSYPAMTEKTVPLMPSLEDSLGHWCTLTRCDEFAPVLVHL